DYDEEDYFPELNEYRERIPRAIICHTI
ncbi:MAG: hypothetical protein ACI8RD_003453, partial [Bacillariaceae sp.]